MASTKSGQNAILWVIAGGMGLFLYKNISRKKTPAKAATAGTSSADDKITKQSAQSQPQQSSKGSGGGSGSGSGGGSQAAAAAKADPMGGVQQKLNDYFGDPQEAKDLTANLAKGMTIEDASNKVGEDPKEVVSALTGVDVTKDVETITDPMGTQLIPELNGTLGTAAGPLSANETAYTQGANGIAPDASTVGGGIGDSLASAINNIVAGVTGIPSLGNTPVDTEYKAPNTELIPEEVADPSMGNDDGTSENGDQSGDDNSDDDAMDDGEESDDTGNDGSASDGGDDGSSSGGDYSGGGDDSNGDDGGGGGGGGGYDGGGGEDMMDDE